MAATLSAAQLLRPSTQELLRQLPTGRAAAVWKYFGLCLDTPRPSGHLALIKERLTHVARQLGVAADEDAVGNIVIRRPAGPGYEKAPVVCVQCHMDMVASQNEDSSHNFETDPIDAYVDGQWLKARRTTLGADDGIGVAACLALLEETDPLPALELLFTVEEETDMSGALQLAGPPFLQARLLFNVDNEDEHTICVGCAGGFERRVEVEVDWEPVGEGHVALAVHVAGLVGGHSGGDIHRAHGNAIKWLASMLAAAPHCLPRLAALKAGTAVNAIPRECAATLVVAGGQAGELVACLGREMGRLQAYHRLTDGDATLHVAAAALPASVLTMPSSTKVYDLLHVLPHGPIRMSQAVAGLTETSVAFTLAELQPDHFYGHVFCRSSVDSQMRAYGRELDSLARLAGARISKDLCAFPGWNPNMDSRTLAVCKAAHEKLFGRAPTVMGVHAGLECGIIQERYPDMDCVSFGPDVQGAHSPDERLLVASVEPFYVWLVECLRSITP